MFLICYSVFVMFLIFLVSRVNGDSTKDAAIFSVKTMSCFFAAIAIIMFVFSAVNWVWEWVK